MTDSLRPFPACARRLGWQGADVPDLAAVFDAWLEASDACQSPFRDEDDWCLPHPGSGL
jgi:hypothetical protein